MAIVQKLQQQEPVSGFSFKVGLLKRHGKIVIGPDENLKKKLMH